MELWTVRTPEAGTIEHQAERVARAGWDGVAFTDSQNLIGDPFVAATLAGRAVEGLKVGTGVSNVATRHPAALATVAATANEETGGRFTLGVGRGDTALFHLGRKPQPVVPFEERLAQVQAYLRGETIDQHGHPSRIHWLDRARHGKTTLDVACSGPKVIGVAARIADTLTFAVGADLDRLTWAIELAKEEAEAVGRVPATLGFGAYVNVGCHPDLESARALIAGPVAAFAHFSAMPGSTGDGLSEEDRHVVEEVGRRYDSNEHLRNDAAHADALDPDFVDRFAVAGPPEVCVERLRALGDLGLTRLVITTAGMRSDRDDAKLSARLLATEVLPALRGQPVKGAP